MFDNKKIILASRSPRRQMILTEAGIDFMVKPVDIIEDHNIDLPADQIAQFIAEHKAMQFPYLKANEIVIAADTTVIVGEPSILSFCFNHALPTCCRRLCAAHGVDPTATKCRCFPPWISSLVLGCGSASCPNVQSSPPTHA